MNEDKIQNMVEKCDRIETTKSELRRAKYFFDEILKSQVELRSIKSGSTYVISAFVNTRLKEAMEIYIQSLMDDLNKLVKE